MDSAIRMKNLLKEFEETSANLRLLEVRVLDMQKEIEFLNNRKSELSDAILQLASLSNAGHQSLTQESKPKFQNEIIGFDSLRRNLSGFNVRTQLEHIVSNAPGIFKFPPSVQDLVRTLYHLKRGQGTEVPTIYRNMHLRTIRSSVIKRMFQAYKSDRSEEIWIFPDDWGKSNYMVAFHEWIKEYNMYPVDALDIK